MDNWFTSVPLAKELLQDPHKLTIVGTIRSNKREIPSKLLQPRQTRSSMFCYDGNCTLVSFRPKKNKNVLLLSTTHGIGTLAPSGKPDIIEFYNSTKGAVDTFDQMCHNMSCNRKTQRWPLCYFYGMLNMSMVNSFVIHVHNNMNNQHRPLKRRAFIKEVSDKMIEPWLRRRRETPTLRRCLKRNIDAILGDTLPDAPVNPENQSRKLCNFCCYKKKNV